MTAATGTEFVDRHGDHLVVADADLAEMREELALAMCRTWDEVRHVDPAVVLRDIDDTFRGGVKAFLAHR